MKIKIKLIILLYTICFSQIAKSQCSIISYGTTLSGLKQLWGQSFVPTCNDPITTISFNAATVVNSSFTLTIRDGADCNATVLHTQTISNIIDGDNLVNLSMPVTVVAGNTYYFSVETNGTTTWRVRYSNTSKVAGNLKTHQPTSPKSVCDLDWPNYDMSFSINYNVPFPELGKQVDLFILGGQSNALGAKGDGAFYPTDTLNLDKSIGLNFTRVGVTSSFGKWITMQPQETPDFANGNFGPEVSFSRKLKATGYNPAIFKYTKGGTSINSFWKTPGDGGQYDELVTTLKTAIKDLENKGFTVTPRAFIWIQGEADSANDSIANLYYGKLLSIVKDVRTNVVKNINLPIILGVDEQYSTKVSIIVSAQQKIANEESNVRFTSMIGLEKADYTHLTPAGLYPHGLRLFNAFQDILNTTEIQNLQIVNNEISYNDKCLHLPYGVFDVQIFDSAGRMVVHQNVSNGFLQLNLNKGLYIVLAKIKGQLTSKKINI